jgi:hypothetical protein
MWPFERQLTSYLLRNTFCSVDEYMSRYLTEYDV